MRSSRRRGKAERQGARGRRDVIEVEVVDAEYLEDIIDKGTSYITNKMGRDNLSAQSHFLLRKYYEMQDI